MVLGQCIEILRNHHNNQNRVGASHGFGGVIPFRQNKLTELLFGNAILKKETKVVMIVNLSLLTAYEENVGVLRYASLAHEIEALPASELGGSVLRCASGEVRAEEGTYNFLPINLLFYPPVLSSFYLLRYHSILSPLYFSFPFFSLSRLFWFQLIMS